MADSQHMEPAASPDGADGDGRTRASENRARLLAVTSLAAGVLLVVLVVGFLVRNGLEVALGLVGLVVAIAGGWLVITGRAFRRLLGYAGVAVGAALIAVALLRAGQEDWASIVRLVAALLLLTLAITAAREAFVTRLRASGRFVPQRVEPPHHAVLLCNPWSGGGKVERFGLEGLAASLGVESVRLDHGLDLAELARGAVARGADCLGMAGGDGSQALVATIASRHDIPHVVVPAGTRNHFALDLGLDREDVVGALDAYTDGVEVRIDLATVNGRIFVNNASLGLYAKIVQSPEYRDAKRQTAAEMLPEMLGPDAAPLDLRFTGPDGTSYPTAHMILVSNDPYQLHSLAGRGTRERMDLGVLGIVAARISSAIDASRFVALEAAGQVSRFPGWLEWTAAEFRVDSEAPVEIGVDGEAMKLDPPLLFASTAGALRVRMPRHASGLSPSATTTHVLSESAIAELAGVVAGRRPPS